MTVLHIPVSLMLVGIVLRGSAFTFRTYDDEHDAAQRRWGRIFSIASVLTPLLLGVCIGAVASGRVVAPTGGTSPSGSWSRGSRRSRSGVGVLTLALFAFLAAVFLTLETHDRGAGRGLPAEGAGGRRRGIPRRRLLVLVLSFADAPLMSRGLAGSSWALPLHLATAASAVAVFAALWSRRYRLARLGGRRCRSRSSSGAGSARSIPTWCPPDLTVDSAAAPGDHPAADPGGPGASARWCWCRPALSLPGVQERSPAAAPADGERTRRPSSQSPSSRTPCPTRPARHLTPRSRTAGAEAIDACCAGEAAALGGR